VIKGLEGRRIARPAFWNLSLSVHLLLHLYFGADDKKVHRHPKKYAGAIPAALAAGVHKKVVFDNHTPKLPKMRLSGMSLLNSSYNCAMPRRSTDPNLSEHEVSVLQRREQHGWFVNRIAEDADGPAFAYSFGLYEEFGHPEIIIFGLPEGTMQQLINDVGRRVRSGVRYATGDVSSELIENYTCAFRAVNPLQYRNTFTWTVWFYERESFPALQLFWPDKQGKFPWEAGFKEQLRHRQPDLSRAPVDPVDTNLAKNGVLSNYDFESTPSARMMVLHGGIAR